MFRRFHPWHLVLLSLAALGAGSATAQNGKPASAAKPVNEVSKSSASILGANRPEEAVKALASLAQAAQFLDAANLTWTEQRKCGTCHTNYPYLMTRRAVTGSDRSEAFATIRGFFENRALNWDKVKPTWDAEVISTAAALAWDDQLAGKVGSHPAKVAWDRMWKTQKKDGGFEWLKCNWPPAEHDDYYGAIVAGMAVMVAPQSWKDEAKEPIAKVTEYLKSKTPDSLHHELLRAWVLARMGSPLPEAETAKIVERLRAAAKADGGWSLVSLGAWKRHNGEVNDLAKAEADGYGTAIVVVALEGLGDSGVAGAVDLAKGGRSWLAKHQRESGRWFTRSPSNDKYHYMTHAGTAWAAYVLSKPAPKGE